MFNNGLEDGTVIYVKEALYGAYGANKKYGVVTSEVNKCEDGIEVTDLSKTFLVNLGCDGIWNIGTKAIYEVVNADETKISSTTKINEPTFSIAIKRVIHHAPATIVYWENGDRTVVKANDEEYDAEKGLAMAIIKYMSGNKGNYYEIFKKHCPEVNNE